MYLHDGNTQWRKKELYMHVDKATYLWLLQECGRRIPISGLILTEKALQFNRSLMVRSLLLISRVAKDCWIISSNTMECTISRLLGKAFCWPTEHPALHWKLHKLIQEKGTQLEQLYNANETRFFWDVLPNKTLASVQKKEAQRLNNPPRLCKCHRTAQAETGTHWKVQEI